MPQSKLRVYIHFAWATWDRLPLISPEIESSLYKCISSVFQECGCQMMAIGGTEDHIHLLIGISGNITLSDLMERVKGSSSRWMNEKLENAFKWQGGYGAFSVSPHDKERVIRYIQNQKQLHADNTLWSEAEKTSEP